MLLSLLLPMLLFQDRPITKQFGKKDLRMDGGNFEMEEEQEMTEILD